MIKKKYTGRIRRFVSVLLATTLILSLPFYGDNDTLNSLLGNVTAQAVASSEKAEKTKTEQELNQVQGEISSLENSKSQVSSQIQANQQELDALIDDIEELEGEISDKQAEIDQCNEDLANAEKQADDEYQSMKKRIQYMYENSTWDNMFYAIIEADGISDMLNRLEYINDVYNSDRDLLTSYQDAVSDVEDLKTKLTDDMEQLTTLEDEYNSKEETLETKLAQLQDQKAQYASQIARAESLATSYKNKIASLASTIQAAEEAAAKAAAEEAARKQAAAAAAARQSSSSSSRSSSSSSSSYSGGGSSGGSSDSSTMSGNANPSGTTGVSGEAVVAYALQFVGNPYVWGGNSLTNGCDCSGFVHLVYAHFGISTPRYSQAFLNYGQAVSYNNIQAGDVVVYPGHVAIYMGNGCIVEAQSTNAGITAGRALNCHSINGIRRYV